MNNKPSRFNIRIRQGLFVLAALGFILACAGAAADAGSANPKALFYKANGFYEKGDYAKAIAAYRELLDSGWESGSVYYNLGNAYYKAGERGRAILYYEKARRLIPDDSDLKANLAFASAGNEKTVSNWQNDLFDTIAHRAPLDQLLLLASLCFFLLTGLAICAVINPPALHIRKGSGWNRWWLIPTLGIGLSLIGTAGVAGFTLAERLQTWAVSVEPGAVRFEPTAHSTVYYRLPEGTRLRVLDSKQDWWMVERDDHKRGWVQANLLGKI